MVTYEQETIGQVRVRKCLDCLALVMPWDTDGHDRWHADMDDKLAMTRVKIVHTQHQVIGLAALGLGPNGEAILLCMGEVGADRCMMFAGHPGRCMTGPELAAATQP